MLNKFFELLSNFFSSLFGGKKTEPAPTPTTRPTPRPGNTSGITEDSSDVPVDTIINVKVTEADQFIPIGSGPFGDDDKESAVENTGKTGVEPAPSSGEGEPAKPGTSTTGSQTGTTKPGTTTTTTPSTTGTTTTKPTQKGRFLWCLNNGHGKLQEGKRSPLFDDGTTRFFEYEFNRDIVERIIKALEKEGVQYFDVVPDYLTVGQFLPERVKRANDKKSDLPKIYVTVHANAAPTSSGSGWSETDTKGIETWFAATSTKGVKLAAVFQKHLIEKTGFKNRGLKSTASSSLYELKETAMPAVLTENGFFNNKNEVKELMKDSVRQKIADAHVAAILEIEKNGIV